MSRFKLFLSFDNVLFKMGIFEYVQSPHETWTHDKTLLYKAKWVLNGYIFQLVHFSLGYE